ncbi:MAG TPA: exonuclease subunit SbcD [Sedimenticola thiotaurini]|uniref:Nuclease SbcCD subunit D n=1 Tax=Sedimenticola thiotaurini TaxID=1543721 RepID=A0A831RNJ2_9GAMM|nr:exonuclease subunit SbcD [Sedimenticola thiotaurini]
MRLIHTADWHLGHSLYGVSRRFEHQRFLDWLLERLQAVEADALLVAGDIFDSTNPPASAFALFYGFLTEARRRMPGLDLILIGGNHDSAARLEAPSSLFQALGIRVIGGLARTPDGEPDVQRLLCPLHDRQGRVAGHCVAVPFLRNSDLPPADPAGAGDPLIEGVRARYRFLFDAARGLRRPGQALVAMGHCYMVRGRVSELSERRILGGNQHALPVDLFPPGVAYAALGHLHLAQAVDAEGRIRYSGSPIPLSLDEADYPHQVVQVDLEGERLVDAVALPVPRSVPILRLPETGPAPLEQVIEALERLQPDPDCPVERRPYLELRVRLERPQPGLRETLEARCRDLPLRLLRVSSHYTGTADPLAETVPRQRLEELDPEQVFSRCYQAAHKGPPPDELLSCYRELLEQVQQAEPD